VTSKQAERKIAQLTAKRDKLKAELDKTKEALAAAKEERNALKTPKAEKKPAAPATPGA